MSERHKERLLWVAALAIGVIVLWWLWSRSHAAAVTVGAPTTVLGNPPSQIDLSFQNPKNAFTNQATGYVPLFGFLSFSHQWA